MLNRVTFILAAVCTLALSTLTGCVKTFEPVLEQENAIQFRAGSLLLNDDATKADYYDNTSFGVFAFKQSGGTWSQLASKHWKPNFMFNQEVHCSGSTFTYSPTRFWPDPAESSLTFWAYSPYSSSQVLYATGTTNAYTSTSEGLPDILYTVDGQTDFLVSSVVEDQTSASNSGLVVIPFNHALSMVDVSVVKVDPTSKYTVKLKAVRFDGIYSTAVLRSSGWADWSGARGNLVLYADNPADNTDDITLTTTAQSLPPVIPLPQELTNAAARLHVEFTVSYAGILHERTTAREVLLSNVFENVGSHWEKNKHYTLELRVSPDDPIEFTVSWSDWGDVFNYQITS